MTPLLLLASLLLLPPQEDVLDAAQTRIRSGQWPEAAALLSDRLRRGEGSARLHALYAEVLEELDRRDEAAYQAETALELLGRDGQDSSREYAATRRLLFRIDPVARSRHAFFEDVVEGYIDISRKLLGSGHNERAVKILEHLEGHARGKNRAAQEGLLEKARAAFERVDLEGGAERESIEENLEFESEHYWLDCDLEREVVQRLADTMDDIFRYYVEVYFGGDEKRVLDRKATIRIHADKESMLANWDGQAQAPAGWWSPGEWKVTTYDTRSDGQPIEVMLSILFHEASHQFMSMLTARGGSAPSWLNEGTASFFEGAIAMADRRVLWPEAALGRLGTLSGQLRSGRELTLQEVVDYSDPGSYPPEYYSFGWGLVYFLQQYEDHETLAHVWRPYYQEFRERVTTRGGNSRQVFEEVFLAPDNPGGFASFAEFEQVWSDWILGVVYEEHFGRERSKLRRVRMERYVAAADRGDGPVDEEELLLRALAQAEFLRANPDRDSREGPDEDLAFVLLTQIDVFERLGRRGAAAATIESLLELADEGRVALTDDALEELNERMSKLDRRNAPLRLLRLRQASFGKRAHSLLSRYERDDEPWHLRSFTLARGAGLVLDDEDRLLPLSDTLYAAAVEAELVPSRVVDVVGEPGSWISVFSDDQAEITFGEKQVSISIPGRPAGRVSTALELEGRYEVRGTLHRLGEVHRSSFHGIVVAGTDSTDWYAVGIGSRNKLVIKRCEVDASGSTLLRNVASMDLDTPPELLDPVVLSIHVRDPSTLEIVLGGGEAVRVSLPAPIVFPTHVGLMVKDGAARLENLHVEIFP